MLSSSPGKNLGFETSPFKVNRKNTKLSVIVFYICNNFFPVNRRHGRIDGWYGLGFISLLQITSSQGPQERVHL